jgi:hypothetical protein
VTGVVLACIHILEAKRAQVCTQIGSHVMFLERVTENG